MRLLLFAALLSASLAAGQNKLAPAAPDNSKHIKDEVTVQGCVSRSSGDYILFRQDPGVTYELEASGKMRLRDYLGQRVEVTGPESPSLGTSSDAMTRTGSASPVTITVSSIRTIAKECSAGEGR
ncbi:MAG: hypothetical protein ACLQBK_10075 [Candidatus Sulfotelmatobacter sp.]